MLIQKPNAISLDKTIQKYQSVIYNNLINLGWVKYQSYERAVVNPKNGSLTHEISEGKNEYKEVMFSDKFNCLSYFLCSDNRRQINTGLISVDCSIIFQARLNKLYSSIAHRADEEFNTDVINAFGIYKKNITEIITGVQNVYGSVRDAERLSIVDMSNFHVVKIDFTATYNNDCIC